LIEMEMEISYIQKRLDTQGREFYMLEGMLTGRYMHYFLMSNNPHKLQRNTLVYDLLIEDGRCYGVKALVNG